MEIFSALLVFCKRNSLDTGDFPAQGPVARNSDVFFNLRLNKRLSKQSRRRSFEAQSRPSWRHCNVRAPVTEDFSIFTRDLMHSLWSLLVTAIYSSLIFRKWPMHNVRYSSWSNKELVMLLISYGNSDSHDAVIKWKHFPRYCSFLRGIHRSPMNSPHKGQWRGTLMFYLICTWINGWVNNGEAGDLRNHRAHYDVILIL